MKKILILLTSSYPYGEGETFLANEIRYLVSAFDEIVILSNDTESESVRPLPPSVTSLRQSYELSRLETLLSVFGMLRRAVWRELSFVRRRYHIPLTRKVLSTILVSCYRAGKFSRTIRRLARRHPGAEVHAYAYWASDVAIAAALARRRGWVDHAFCRAHGWDVYFDRAEAGFLPFRHFLATHLDHYLFVSEHGRAYFEAQMGRRSYPSVGVSRLGTPPVTPVPLARLRPFTLVSCSSMIPVKRVELIAKALEHTASNVRWIHIGEGPTRASVEAIRERLPPTVEVQLEGHLPNPAVLALYATVRPSLFVNVSRSEGLPVSMMEAMSVGIPVLGTDVGGVGEIVSNGKNGMLVASDPTPEEVAAAIDAFSALDEREYRTYAERAWATWHEKFNAETNYEAFVDTILDRMRLS